MYDNYASICDTVSDKCHGNPCLNEGRCVPEMLGYRCECREGWSGDVCEKGDIDNLFSLH